jgi:hypothetical protein
MENGNRVRSETLVHCVIRYLRVSAYLNPPGADVGTRFGPFSQGSGSSLSPTPTSSPSPWTSLEFRSSSSARTLRLALASRDATVPGGR